LGLAGDWPVPVAVPGSWNEQLGELGLMNFTGSVRYTRKVFVPERAAGRRIALHFGSADYAADVFWNGRKVGESGSPKLPFDVELTGIAQAGEVGELMVIVTCEVPEHGPMQRVTSEDYVNERRPKDEYWPAVRFDFFPFGGLNRSVTLNLLPKACLGPPVIRTAWAASGGILDVWCPGANRLLLEGAGMDRQDVACGEINHVKPWSPEAPTLYTLTLQKLNADGEVEDEISRRIGFRTFEIAGQSALLNGAAFELKGFGKHEDTPIAGRGVNLPYLVKDFHLLKWAGANSVRTSHYPYDEAFLDLADEMGILVISEVFSVNLDFRRTDGRDLAAHKDALSRQMLRDGHHACVIAWSLANEPGYLGEVEYREKSAPYWRELFSHARTVDASRPLTVANVQYAGIDDPAFDESDFLSINRYFGWYTEPGQIERACDRLVETLDILSARHSKPIFLAEFGADAVAGMHSTTDQMWTEDYQSDLIEAYWRVIDTHPACLGGHVWNFADFRTAQHGRRAVLNRKGVFTRERDPKRAAFTLRRLWSGV
jgi:beta-glucuronidase